MRVRFRAWVSNGWELPDAGWIREVRHNARFLWVRFQGLTDVQKSTDRGRISSLAPGPAMRTLPGVVQWEQTAHALAPVRPPALVLVRFRQLAPGGRNIFLGPPSEVLRRWGMTVPLRDAVRELLEDLRRIQPHPVGIFAEDFAARWVMEAGVDVHAAIWDNPVVSRDEASRSPLFSKPGFVRQSAWTAPDDWDRWGMHFARDQLLVGHASRHPHGRWPPTALLHRERAALRPSRPSAPRVSVRVLRSGEPLY